MTCGWLTVGAPMTEAEATALLNQIMTLTGAFSFGAP
jgi:hypothetical protein